MANLHSILVVEDSRFQAKLIQTLLGEKGYPVRVARNGREGLDALDEERPSIILSDIVMPVMDGFQMCRTTKSQDELKQIPIILLTTQSRPQDVLLGLESGADSYVTKPYDEKILLSTIEEMISGPSRLPGGESGEESLPALDGQFHTMKADRRQMVNFLLSAYRDSFLQNQRMEEARKKLGILNEQLEKLVFERTKALEEEIAKRRIAQEKLRRLAITDGLTQVFNYRYFMELGRREFERVRRYHRQLSLIIADIDYFKKTNDTYGHAAGDGAIRVVAQICQKTLRSVDILGRIGGEEFAVLLPETGLEQAWLVAERLRTNVSRALMRSKRGEIRLTLSLGVGAVDEETEDFEGLLRSVDSALYAAKRNGRDRVEKIASGHF
jgi:diguanylate cyclase (GGDEF)-like protein